MDHYRVLGVRRDASTEEIKTAFRKMAKQWHPDKHSGASESVQQKAEVRFRQAAEAYEVLGNENKRAVYNRDGGGSTATRTNRGAEYAYGPRYRPGPRAGGGTGGSSSGWDYGGQTYSDGSANHRQGQGSGSQSQGTGFRGTGGGSSVASGAGFSEGGADFGVRERWWRLPVRTLSRHDAVLHVALAGVLLTGVIFGGSVGDYIWRKRNEGKSFEEVMEALHKSRGDNSSSSGKSQKPE